MANKLVQSFLNPVWFYQMNPQQLDQYVSRHLDLYPHLDTIELWQTRKAWAQPWQTSDEIVLQYQSDYAPLRIKLIDGWERVYKTVNATTRQENRLVPGMMIQEFSVPLTGTANGFYFLKMECGAGGDGKPLETWISNPLQILNFHAETLYLEYKHRQFKGVFIFETGIAPKVRIKGRLSLLSPSAKDTLYEDEELSQRLTDSKPFEEYELTIGHTGARGISGIPDIHAKQLSRILGCSETLIDGRQYSKAEPNMSPITEKNYPLKAYTIKMRDVENKDALTYENSEVNLGPDSFIMSVDAKGFGLSDQGQTQIIDVQ